MEYLSYKGGNLMYVLVANDLDYSLKLYFLDNFELDDCYYFKTFCEYIRARDFFLNCILI